MAPFFDLMIIGEGEEVNDEVLAAVPRRRSRPAGARRGISRAGGADRGRAMCRRSTSPRLECRTARWHGHAPPTHGAPARVTKRIVAGSGHGCFIRRTPSSRLRRSCTTASNVELFRGCIRGCRFCQAGYVYRPVRPPQAGDDASGRASNRSKTPAIRRSTLLSLSTQRLPPARRAVRRPAGLLRRRAASVSRCRRCARTTSPWTSCSALQKVRKSGLTFAPEAGTQRLRDAINKNVTRGGSARTPAAVAFEGGWNSVKLYFMLGLPTETDEDVLGIAELADRGAALLARARDATRAAGVRITVSTSCFVPKPHTPVPVGAAGHARRSICAACTLLREQYAGARAVTYNWHDAGHRASSRPCSRAATGASAHVIEEVWRQGGMLESWSEDYFSFDRWMAAMEECGVDPHVLCQPRALRLDEVPAVGSSLNMGVRTRASVCTSASRPTKAELSPDCRSAVHRLRRARTS